MKWQILDKQAEKKENRLTLEEIIKILLNNRGIKTKKETKEFLNPLSPESFKAIDLGIDPKEVKKAVIRILKAVKNQESIIVYGDYDADGICATAIMWETLYQLTKNVLPYIPERVSEGYGLNNDSITNLKKQNPDLGLIVTVDHGITGAEKIKHAKKLGIDVVVCDHHQLGKKMPRCAAVVHTDKICAAAIAGFVSKEIQKAAKVKQMEDYLDLIAIASIADLEPLVGVNRSYVKFGLEKLNQTRRAGLLYIFQEAGLSLGQIGTYEVGFIIAPRLNAAGRIEHALESLRLLCTRDEKKAKQLAEKLGKTNKDRQVLLEETSKHAFQILSYEARGAKIIFAADRSYNQGIIGLVAGKIVEQYYRPAIVFSIGEEYSKASARSISGFNIIKAIREHSDLLIESGGHPLAAGFTVLTEKIELLKQRLVQTAEQEISAELLERSLKVDLSLPVSFVSQKLWEEVQKMSPFGMGNFEPVFCSRVTVVDFRTVGAEKKHLKLTVLEPQDSRKDRVVFSAIAFNQGIWAEKLKVGQEIKIAFSIFVNEWNNHKTLELKLKDIDDGN